MFLVRWRSFFPTTRIDFSVSEGGGKRERVVVIKNKFGNLEREGERGGE